MAYSLKQSSAEVLITEGAYVAGDVTLGKGCSVWYGAALRGDRGPIVIGENTNVQDNVVMHDETHIGRGCTIGHGAIVHGCTIGDNTLIGMGAVVISGARIGSNCIIGAGSLVTGKMEIPDGSMAFGSPAKVIRPLTPEEIQSNVESAEEYLDRVEAYRTGRY